MKRIDKIIKLFAVLFFFLTNEIPIFSQGNFETSILAYKNKKLSINERVLDLMNRMTVEEKIAQMVGFWNYPKHCDDNGNIELGKDSVLLINGIGEISTGNRGLGPKASAIFMNNIQSFMLKHTRLGIPAMAHDEALHGHLAAEATSFPQSLALGSTWDTELIEKIFEAVAKEVRSRGVHQVLGPVLDVARDARFGRTEEMYGEDPYLVSMIGVACVRGLQGRNESIDNQHVIATGKHFAAHGQPEGGYNGAPATCSERMLKEVFLSPFKAAVKEAHLYSMMPAYNEIDGIPCHINKTLINDVLRNEWGFKGYVVSDYSGIAQLITSHHITEKREHAAITALQAGVDMELPGIDTYQLLIELVKAGKIDISLIDKSVERILRAKFMLGLFENPFVDTERAAQITNSKEHQQLALEAARRAVILLKNDNQLLPLNFNKIKNIAVIGPNAAECHSGGYGCSPSNAISILEGIKRKAGKKINVNYALGCGIVNTGNIKEDWNNVPLVGGAFSNSGGITLFTWKEDSTNIAEAVATAKKSDVAIVVVGENEFTCREGWTSHLGDRADLNLLGSQDKLVKSILETKVPTIVILIHGRPNSINYIAENVPAILEGWYLGQETGNAVADILFGDYNPGGKLTISIPRSVGQLPTYYSKKPSAMTNNYYFTSNTPLFPFGFGLSYTTFSYSNLELSNKNIQLLDTLSITAEIKNTGTLKGDEVVQLYIRDMESSVTRPVKELKGFKRITLNPGEQRKVTFTLSVEELSFYNEEMKFTYEPGVFELMVGSSSENILLRSKFELIEN